MKKYLNTLFVTTQGAYLSKENETLVVSVERETKLQLPIHALGGIICFGNVSMSPFLMGFCAEKGVGVSFCSEYGRFLAGIRGKISGNVLLRREQYKLADNEKFKNNMCRLVITGKLSNCRTVLQRVLRDHNDKINSEEIKTVVKRLDYILENLSEDSSSDVLRGREGEAGHSYFSVFDHLIVAQKDNFFFKERSRRPPLDNVNCLLSFFYMLLMHDIRSALESVGLDPCVGFLHCERPGRSSLALDIMEEFRPFIADRLALSLINREQVNEKGFKKSETGGVLMDDDTRKIVLTAYQKRKQEEIEHPYLKESMPVGILFYVQALLLARYIRGDIDGYPVFIWR